MIKKKILHPEKRYKKAESEDLSLKVGFDTNEQLLREGDRTIILDIAEQFSKERNESDKYKIYGKVNMVFRNTYGGTSTYEPLLNNLYLSTDTYDPNDYEGFMQYNEFAFIRGDYISEQSNATSNSIGEFSPNITIPNGSGHIDFTESDAPFVNWNFYLTYVFDKDPTYNMRYTLSGGTVYNFTAETGIPFRITDDGDSFKLTSPNPHNMSQGEYVVLSGSSMNQNSRADRVFPINSVGDETFNSEKYVINISKSNFTQNQITMMSTMGVVFGRRCLDKTDVENTTSSYYVRKHKTITSADDYIIESTGFESPIFENERKLQFETPDGRDNVYVELNRPESILYHFKNPITTNGLTNNLGYTPTEVYLTTIFRNGNGYFNYPPRLGWRFNFHNTWVDEQFNTSFNSSNTNIPYTTFTQDSKNFNVGDEIPVGTEIIGDFVEYNNVEFKETILSDTYHKITLPYTLFNHGQTSTNTFSGVSTTNPCGLFYKTHHKIKLRELSPYIETNPTNDIMNLPENTIYDEVEKVWKWRDLYDHGYIDPDGYGVNHPFTNGQHYVKNDINFLLKNEVSFKNKTDGIKNFTKDPNALC